MLIFEMLNVDENDRPTAAEILQMPIVKHWSILKKESEDL